ncbi:MAG: DUF4065 domain-containing protein [Ignavibacteriales bacterium]|nr:DUF4065 domain-containing protein [Ignavibacteriales bacterium]
MPTTKDILLQILEESSIQHTSFGKTQLVKLLYLTEVEYYRNYNERLTDLEWLFYHYGPYALAIDDILNERDFVQTKAKIKNEKNLILIKVAEGLSRYKSEVDTKVSLIIKKIVGQWKDRLLEDLLDYVYFETEPMEAVDKRGDVLDFTTIKKETNKVVIPLKASKETEQRVAELRKRIAPTLKRLSEQRVTEKHEGKEYQKAIEAWDEEEQVDAESLRHLKIIIKP